MLTGCKLRLTWTGLSSLNLTSYLIGMGLNGQRLADGQNLEQEGQLSLSGECLPDLFPKEFRIRSEPLLQRDFLPRVHRRALWVRSHPQLSTGVQVSTKIITRRNECTKVTSSATYNWNGTNNEHTMHQQIISVCARDDLIIPMSGMIS